MCGTAQQKMKKGLEYIESAAVAVLCISMVAGVGAGNMETFLAAVAVMAASLAVVEEIEAAKEKRKDRPAPEQVKKKIEEMDREAAASGQFDYIYQPEYSFITYLQDNASSLRDLIQKIDESNNPRVMFEMVYRDYRNTAGESRTQTKEQIQGMIWRERGRRG
ncbi:MAG: hypothetical protein NC300_11315 [Bacteroidales bacterium]|nr:hypothetical protein [Clostridium sp.]MCM1204720.1 hypothetical protein [Bacteroidales bacterium]